MSMKKTIILLSFVSVIALGIGALYFSSPSLTNQVAEETATTSITDTAATEKDELASLPETISTTATAEEDATADTNPNGTTAADDTTRTPAPVITATPAPVTTPIVATPTTATNNDYVNGTYTSTVTYSVPEGGREPLTVTLTITNDTVTALTVSQDADKRESRQYQSRFANAIESYVVGEAIDGLDLSRVGGASLTTRAFNNAVKDIRADAAA